jgi:hypothetical protein
MSPTHGVTASAETSPTSVPATATEVSFSVFNLRFPQHAAALGHADTLAKE